MLPQGTDKGDVFFPRREPGFRPQVLLQALLGPVSFHLALILGHRPSGSRLGSRGAYSDSHLVSYECGVQIAPQDYRSVPSPLAASPGCPLGSRDWGRCSSCGRTRLTWSPETAQAPAEVSVGLTPALRLLQVSAQVRAALAADRASPSRGHPWQFLLLVGR